MRVIISQAEAMRVNYPLPPTLATCLPPSTIAIYCRPLPIITSYCCSSLMSTFVRRHRLPLPLPQSPTSFLTAPCHLPSYNFYYPQPSPSAIAATFHPATSAILYHHHLLSLSPSILSILLSSTITIYCHCHLPSCQFYYPLPSPSITITTLYPTTFGILYSHHLLPLSPLS